MADIVVIISVSLAFSNLGRNKNLRSDHTSQETQPFPYLFIAESNQINI
jgi:hypothetical protein